MLSLNDYLADPCGTLSIPYWKASRITIPRDISVIHHRDLTAAPQGSYQRYFRLIHRFDEIPAPALPGIALITAQAGDISTIVSVINGSYPDIQVAPSQVEGFRSTEVFDPELWLLAIHTESGKCAACGIADLDRVAGELILEWIQVLPEYRRLGIGRAMVAELLRRGQNKAAFATVSGKLDDPSDPEALYRACGFTGNDVWYVCRA